MDDVKNTLRRLKPFIGHKADRIWSRYTTAGIDEKNQWQQMVNLLAQKYKIGRNVHLWGYHDHKKSLASLKKMDALCLILDDRISNSKNTVGGKVYEYLRLRKPIFAIISDDGEAAAIINKTNSGIVISARDNEKIAEKLNSLIKNEHQFTWQGIEAFSRERQADTLNSFLKDVLTFNQKNA